jgi:hypothetical protein
MLRNNALSHQRGTEHVGSKKRLGNLQTRSVLSEDPVATRLPRGFQAIERRLTQTVSKGFLYNPSLSISYL